jgi:ABC-type transporter Mla subunit MlaD
MYNTENAQQSIIALRDAINSSRTTAPEDIDPLALQLVLARAMVDLSLAGELINTLVESQAAQDTQMKSLTSQLENLQEEADDAQTRRTRI